MVQFESKHAVAARKTIPAFNSYPHTENLALECPLRNLEQSPPARVRCFVAWALCHPSPVIVASALLHDSPFTKIAMLR